ncbi:hypothetical protein E5288_WYG015118 [Bos mutus]|uniref:Uncharacterized protein n=1 Tax=Bos mutus TaxID=72004 RepID=A0A6B0RMA1_9CETA|nr:hypothetical protein [Bos mutus]
MESVCGEKGSPPPKALQMLIKQEKTLMKQGLWSSFHRMLPVPMWREMPAGADREGEIISRVRCHTSVLRSEYDEVKSGMTLSDYAT